MMDGWSMLNEVMTLGLPAKAMMPMWSSGREPMRLTANEMPLLSLLGWISSQSMESEVSIAMSILRDWIFSRVTELPAYGRVMAMMRQLKPSSEDVSASQNLVGLFLVTSSDWCGVETNAAQTFALFLRVMKMIRMIKGMRMKVANQNG